MSKFAKIYLKFISRCGTINTTFRCIYTSNIDYRRNIMSRCKCCGEILGGSTVCPVCGTVNAVTPTPVAPQFAVNNASSILQQIEIAKTELIERCAKSVTRISVKGRQFEGWGTGWCGYNNLIITNAHVTTLEGDRIQSIEAEFSDKLNLGASQKIPMELIFYSQDEDIAILMPKSGKIPEQVPVLNITDVPTKQGEMVFTIGNPLHYKFTYTEGAVANPDYHDAKRNSQFTTLQTTLTLNSGNSGGPVFNADGSIVGMATYAETRIDTETFIDPLAAEEGENPFTEQALVREIQGYGFCVKSEAILAAIDSIQHKL